MLANVLEETASPGAADRPRHAALQRRGPWARFEGSLREVDELLFAEIAEHRSRPDLEERDDILSLLMLARFEDGGAMTDPSCATS